MREQLNKLAELRDGQTCFDCTSGVLDDRERRVTPPLLKTALIDPFRFPGSLHDPDPASFIGLLRAWTKRSQ